MTRVPSWTDTNREYCPECRADTEHVVTVASRPENGDTTDFGKMPYRRTECTVCGHSSTERMD